MRFAEFFKKATGLEQGPYPFQRAFAEAEADRVPQLISDGLWVMDEV